MLKTIRCLAPKCDSGAEMVMTRYIPVMARRVMKPTRFKFSVPEGSPLRAKVRAAYRMDESTCVRELIAQAQFSTASHARIANTARKFVVETRRRRLESSGIDAFMQQYELSTSEGVALMCLAEALLRIPDAETADRLIKDKILGANWEDHLGTSDSLFVNASTWALMLTGRVIEMDASAQSQHNAAGFIGLLKQLITRSGEPLIRQALVQAMRILGRQFVMGRTIGDALQRAKEYEARGYRYSYDMLGEAAYTAADAERYFNAYTAAIAAIGEASQGMGPIEGPGISVKLSALHPRYEFTQRDRVLRELVPRLEALAGQARDANIGLTVDAEEADRTDLLLDVFEAVFGASALKGWEGFGLAVQTYLKCALPLIDWLGELAAQHRRRLMVRLVKGAYWDSEIKRAQEGGFEAYPVFTRKVSTDVSYLACVQRVFAAGARFYSQFATHNAHSLATILELAGAHRDFECQRLHGMGEALYDQVVGDRGPGIACRIYAPVGSHEDLLAYLVRRLLENGANTSFVNCIVDENLPVNEIIADPVARAMKLDTIAHPSIPLPGGLFGDERQNSTGLDLTHAEALEALIGGMNQSLDEDWRADPVISGVTEAGRQVPIRDPADRRRVVGQASSATADQVGRAIARSQSAQPGWDAMPAEERALVLERAATLFEGQRARLMAMCVREAGKTMLDALSEIREAVDFLRYYAARARADFRSPELLPGPTGERNELALAGRGVFACISPWNFPLAIFTGQVAAALAAGNAVVAKPAEQTPLIAAAAVRLMQQAGVPGDVLQLMPGDGPAVGALLVKDQRIAGVAFTGSIETAQLINRSLAARDGPIVPLIAETGGQNAMIVDSSALPEQVVGDALVSAFRSAGQRCSALRVLFLQEDVADRIIDMLAGAMAELKVGDPGLLSTDIGPVIDEDACAMLQTHSQRMVRDGQLIAEAELAAGTEHGLFFAPRAYEIDAIGRLDREVFGPVLHIVRYAADRLDTVVDAINDTGYGLTISIHSRIESTVRGVHRRLRVGNTYVNRNQIGAVVGVQPFGGEGLSGTGPKAGGPRYLQRFATERTLSIDTTAAGGNAALISLAEEPPA